MNSGEAFGTSDPTGHFPLQQQQWQQRLLSAVGDLAELTLLLSLAIVLHLGGALTHGEERMLRTGCKEAGLEKLESR
jgi:hypothetical protein